MVKAISHISLQLLIFISLIISLSKFTHASVVIFNDNFENDVVGLFPSGWIKVRDFQWSNESLPCMNGSQQAEWKVIEHYGNKKVSITIDGNGCMTTIVPSNILIPNINNYEYSLDITLPAYSNRDRNITFRYANPGDQYGFNVFESYLGFYKRVGYNEYHNDLGTATLNTKLVNNATYNFKVRSINNRFEIFIDNNLVTTKTDSLPYLNHGTIALEGSIGGLGKTITYFDNIILTDLTVVEPTPEPTVEPTKEPTPEPTVEPTIEPTPTLFPYFSQVHPDWKNEQYDHTSSTIGQNGCALSSAAMILAYHGLNKVPLSNELANLTPLALNQWLNSEKTHKRWGRNGALNWLAITELARDLHQIDPQKFTKLEFELVDGNSPTFTQTILALLNDDHLPLIFKESQRQSLSGKHFYVATNGYLKNNSENDYVFTIYDPYKASRTSITSLTNPIQAAYHYYPTESDLSYIWLDADQNLDISLINPQGKLLQHDTYGSITEIPKSIAFLTNTMGDDVDNVDTQDNPFMQYTIKYPDSGYYSLNIIPRTEKEFAFELYLYDKEGNSKVIRKKPSTDSTSQVSYTLVYDQNDTNKSYIINNDAFMLIKRALIETAKNGNYLNKKAYETILKFLATTEKIYYQNQEIGIKQMNSFLKHLENDYKQGKLNSSGFDYVANLSATLITQL